LPRNLLQGASRRSNPDQAGKGLFFKNLIALPHPPSLLDDDGELVYDALVGNAVELAVISLLSG
jgi:hypothetical protein